MNDTKGTPTPGPWSMGEARDTLVRYKLPCVEVPVHVANSGGSTGRGALAIVYLGGKGASSMRREDVEANARLIAAAPEMFEMIKIHLEGTGCDGDLCSRGWHEDFRKLIQKIEDGEE